MEKLSSLPAFPNAPASFFEAMTMPFKAVLWVFEMIVWMYSLPIQFLMDLQGMLNTI